MTVPEQCDRVCPTTIGIKIIASDLIYYCIPYPQDNKSFEATVDTSLFPGGSIFCEFVIEKFGY